MYPDVVENDSAVFERVKHALSGQMTPRTAREIAADAGVDPAVAVPCLSYLDENDVSVSAVRADETVYCIDPITEYVERVGDAVEDVDEAVLRSVRQDVTDWQDFQTAVSTGSVLNYRQGTHLVASSRLPAGTHVYDRDWDVIVILDTCRTDALEAAAPEFDFLEQSRIECRVSLGSQTAEWLSGTFTTDHTDEIAETGYVSGNGWVSAVFQEGLRPDDDLDFDATGLPTDWDVVDADAFEAIVDAWRVDPSAEEYSLETPWDPHPPPRTVTDHAIGLARDRNLERLVVHYKQPHAPYLERARREERSLTPPEASPRVWLKEGRDPAAVWDAYMADLRAVLAEIAALRRNVDGRILITADHGEAFGEDGQIGHRPAQLHPTVKRVPWTTTDGTDEQTRLGTLEAIDSSKGDVEAHLEALGYR